MDISLLDEKGLKQMISQQEGKIAELKEKLEKVDKMSKYRTEHLERIEKRQEALIEEKRSFSEMKKKLNNELSLLQGAPGKKTLLQIEADTAIEFVKQSPLDGVKFLMQDLEMIKAELSEVNIEKSSVTQKRTFEVYFKEESCIIRTSDFKYTFAELAADSALYFNLIPEDCLLKDQFGAIWSSNSQVLQEYNPAEHKLILSLKFGRVGRNPNASEINWHEIAIDSKLENRLKNMEKWVTDRGKTGQKRGIKEESILKSVANFSFYITFLMLLFNFVFNPISLRDAYQLNNSISNIFITQPFPQNCAYQSGATINFLQIISPEQIFCWFSNVLVNEMFNSPDVEMNNNRFFVLRYNQMGGIRVMQYRVKEKSCTTLNYKTGTASNDKPCYAEYSENYKDINNFGPYLQANYSCKGLDCIYMKAFKYSRDPPNSYQILGNVAKYQTSGYYIDAKQIIDNSNLNQTTFLGLFSYLQKYLWIDIKTRAIVVIFSFYNINYNYFTSAELLLEVSGSGYVVARTKLNTLYLNYYYETWNRMKSSADDFFSKIPEIYCYIYSVFGILVPTIIRLKRKGLAYLKQMWVYLDFLLFFLLTGIMVLRVVLYFVCDSIVNEINQKSFDNFTNFSDASYFLSISWGFEAFAVLIASLKLLNYFTINSMTVIWDTLAIGIKAIFAFFVVFIVLMCSFSQMVHIVYGNQLISFTTFTRSMSSLFMILLGALDNYPNMSNAAPYFTPVFFISYIFLMFFIMMNIFVAILNESFRVVVEVKKHGEEKELVGKLKTRLIAEVKFFVDRVRYFCKNCCKKQRLERSAAFKAFNRT